MEKRLKEVKNFFEFRQRNWDSLINYPEHELKKNHGRLGKKALRKLGELLNLETMSVNYNPSGVIDGGYLTLMGMKGEKGIYVNLSCSNLTPDVLYRTTKHMKDYTGGHNNFLSTDSFVINIENCIQNLKNLLGG